MTHPDGKPTEKQTLSEILAVAYPELVGVGESQTFYVNDTPVEVARPGIVHRLDTDTSGVMVIARTQSMHEHLKSQFADHTTIQKEYRAIVYGKPNPVRGQVSLPIGRSQGDEAKWATGARAKDPKRDAVTYYEGIGTILLNKVESNPLEYTLVRAMPKTGRTHQIRVHMASLGTPLLMDTLYAGQRCFKIPSLGFRRQALHAYSLSFLDLTGVRVICTAPYPADFASTLEQVVYTQSIFR